MRYGAETAAKPELRQKRLAAVERLRQKPVLRIDATTGEVFGNLAAQLQVSGRGHSFRVQDLWIASQAIQHGLRLATFHRKDFEDFPAWTPRPDPCPRGLTRPVRGRRRSCRHPRAGVG